METEREAEGGRWDRVECCSADDVCKFSVVSLCIRICCTADVVHVGPAVPLTYCTADVRAGPAVPLAQWPDAGHQEEHRDHVELKGVCAGGGGGG